VSNEVTFTPTEAMLGRAFNLHYKGYGKKQLITYFSIGLTLGVAIAAVDGFNDIYKSIFTIAVMIAWMLFILLLIKVIVRFWWMPRYTKRIYAQQNDLRQTTTTIWDEDSFKSHSETATVVTPWANFYQWRRGDGILLLNRSEAMFNFFPTTGEEFSQAADAIQNHLVAAGVKEKI
jgi:uncharacterized membrane protein YciS (DUF1049 family)